MDWLPVFVAVTIPAGIALLLPRCNVRRLLLIAIVFAFGFHYVIWRLHSFPWIPATVTLEWLWWLLVLLIEMAVIVEVTLFLISIAWLTDRTASADQAEERLRSRFRDQGVAAIPSVDVFITTYNEGLDVLEKSIFAASQIDYPKFKVYVLDDGRRSWLADFCRQVGVHYLTRSGNEGAKAGNINSALVQSHGSLVMIMDADFVAYKNSVWRTAGLFDDCKLGTVQTPQNFFNPDAIQHNLAIASSWCDEQSFFFRLIARGRDALGVAFCCGSCSIHRRSALESANGFPTDSITEDILLTVNFCRLGWKTIYLAEPISTGLAAETLDSFFIQRKRWGRGGIQVAWLMFKKRGLSFVQRLFFFPYSWITQYFSRIFFQLLPIIFFLLGVAPLPEVEMGEQLISYQASYLFALITAMVVLSEGFYMPIFNEAVSLFASFELAPEIFSALLQPFGKGFAVTPKGYDSLAAGSQPYSRTIIPTSILLFFNIIILWRILLAIGDGIMASSSELLIYGLLWCIYNTVLLIVSVLLSLQRPQPRLEHRMRIERPALLRSPVGDVAAGQVADLSLTGALLKLEQACELQPSQQWLLQLENGVELPVEALWRRPQNAVAMRFVPLDVETRRALVGYAFSGEFFSAEQPQRIEPLKTARQLLRQAGL